MTPASRDALIAALVELDRELASDLVVALRDFCDRELAEIGDREFADFNAHRSAGNELNARLTRVGRLEVLRGTIERELGR